MSVNKWIGIGNVCQDLDIKYTANGTAVVNFSIACNEKYKDKQGEYQDKVEFVKLVAFGRTAEVCGEYLTKGKQIYIEGKLQTRSWEGDDGKKNYTTEILVSQMQMLGSRKTDNPAEELPSEHDLQTIPF